MFNKNNPIKYLKIILIVFNISCFNSIISADKQSGDEQFEKALHDLNEQIKNCKDKGSLNEGLENLMSYCWGSPERLKKIMEIMEQAEIVFRYRRVRPVLSEK